MSRAVPDGGATGPRRWRGPRRGWAVLGRGMRGWRARRPCPGTRGWFAGCGSPHRSRPTRPERRSRTRQGWCSCSLSIQLGDGRGSHVHAVEDGNRVRGNQRGEHLDGPPSPRGTNPCRDIRAVGTGVVEVGREDLRGLHHLREGTPVTILRALAVQRPIRRRGEGCLSETTRWTMWSTRGVGHAPRWRRRGCLCPGPSLPSTSAPMLLRLSPWSRPGCCAGSSRNRSDTTGR